MNSIIIFGLISFFVPFLLAIIPRWISPGTRESDPMGHYLGIKEFKKNKHKIPKKYKQTICPGKFEYPYLMYYILSYLPKKSLRKIGDYISPFFFSLNSLLIFVFTYYYMNNPTTALLASLIYSTTPLLLMQGEGIFNISQRPVARLFFNISYLCMVIFISSKNYTFFFISILFASLIFITARFALQVLVFTSIIISIMTLKIWFLLLLILSFLVAIAISEARIITLIKAYILNSYFFYKVLAKDYLGKRNKLKDVLILPIDLIKDPKKAAHTFLSNNSYLILLTHMPTIILFFWLINKNIIIFKSQILFLLLIWFVSTLILFLLTSLKPLLFLGQAERYVNHALVPFSIILAFMISNSLNKSIVISIIIIFLFELALIILYYYIVITTDKYHKDISDGITWLSKQKKQLKVLSIPFNLGAEIAYFTHHIAFDFHSYPRPPYFNKKIWRHYFTKYPFPNLKKFIKEDKINTILTYNDSNKSLDKLKYNFSKFRKVYSKGNVNIYFVKGDGKR